MLSETFKPAFTWITEQRKKPKTLSYDLDESLSIKPSKSMRCELQNQLRNYTKIKTCDNSPAKTDRDYPKHYALMVTLSKCIRNYKKQIKTDPRPVKTIKLTRNSARSRTKSTNISTLTVALMKRKSVNISTRQQQTYKNEICETLKINGKNAIIFPISPDKIGYNLISTGTMPMAISPKKVNFRDLALRRKNLLKITEYQKKCNSTYTSNQTHTNWSYYSTNTSSNPNPILLVSQMSVSNKSFQDIETPKNKRPTTSSSKTKANRFDSSPKLCTHIKHDTLDSLQTQTEYGSFLKKPTLRPITSGAIVIKTREGKPLTLLNKMTNYY